MTSNRIWNGFIGEVAMAWRRSTETSGGGRWCVDGARDAASMARATGVCVDCRPRSRPLSMI